MKSDVAAMEELMEAHRAEPRTPLPSAEMILRRDLEEFRRQDAAEELVRTVHHGADAPTLDREAEAAMELARPDWRTEDPLPLSDEHVAILAKHAGGNPGLQAWRAFREIRALSVGSFRHASWRIL